MLLSKISLLYQYRVLPSFSEFQNTDDLHSVTSLNASHKEHTRAAAFDWPFNTKINDRFTYAKKRVNIHPISHPEMIVQRNIKQDVWLAWWWAFVTQQSHKCLSKHWLLTGHSYCQVTFSFEIKLSLWFYWFFVRSYTSPPLFLHSFWYVA